MEVAIDGRMPTIKITKAKNGSIKITARNLKARSVEEALNTVAGATAPVMHLFEKQPEKEKPKRQPSSS